VRQVKINPYSGDDAYCRVPVVLSICTQGDFNRSYTCVAFPIRFDSKQTWYQFDDRLTLKNRQGHSRTIFLIAPSVMTLSVLCMLMYELTIHIEFFPKFQFYIVLSFTKILNLMHTSLPLPTQVVGLIELLLAQHGTTSTQVGVPNSTPIT
jgi:hypothetical protein